MCFFFDLAVDGTPADLLGPIGGGELLPCPSIAPPKARPKKSPGFCHSGCFPFGSSMPLGIPMSMEVICVPRDVNCPSGVCAYGCDGDGDQTASRLSTSLASS